MKVLSQPMNDVVFDAVAHGRVVARIIADGRGNGYYCLDGPASGAYRTRTGLMHRLQAIHGSGVRLVTGQRRPPRRPPVAASGTGAPRPHPPTVKPPPSGTPQIAPKPAPPRQPTKTASGTSAPFDAAFEIWHFGAPRPIVTSPVVRSVLANGHGCIVGGVTKLPAKHDGASTGAGTITADARQGTRHKPVPTPRPTTRPGGRGTGRRLPRH